jgi:hypothetical protein
LRHELDAERKRKVEDEAARKHNRRAHDTEVKANRIQNDECGTT